MRRTNLVLAAVIVMVAILAIFSVPALADDDWNGGWNDGFSTSFFSNGFGDNGGVSQSNWQAARSGDSSQTITVSG